MTQPLVLSLFPGIGLLDMAFEEEGFCVVRGPDLLWGGDVRRFHPPAGRFDGVIGGPPCKAFSPLVNLAKAQGDRIAENMIPEFERVVAEAAPRWWLSENVIGSPPPRVDGYFNTRPVTLNALDVGGVQDRQRQFCYGTTEPWGLYVETLAVRPAPRFKTVTAQGIKARRGERIVNGSLDPHDACEAQGLPRDFFEQLESALHIDTAPVLTKRGKLLLIGNGVPLPMGRAIAAAVKRAMYPELVEASA